MTLTTDTGERTVSAILPQEGHPIICLSRRSTSAEANCLNIKKAFAIVLEHRYCAPI